MRKTMREISRVFGLEKANNPAATAVIKAVAVGTDKSLKFSASVGVAGVDYQLASDNGRLKTFSDVDSVLKFAAKCAEKGDGIYTVEVDTGALLASSVPSDLKSWAEAQIARLTKAKTAQNVVIAGIDEQLGFMVGWETGNAAQQAKKVEVQAQRAAVVSDIAAIDAENARLAVIAAG